MNDINKYNNIFSEIFSTNVEMLNDEFKKENVDNWDSITQLSLVDQIEGEFKVMFEPEEIIGLTSYNIGKEILRSKGVLL
jgi:acyl carrier protein